MMKLIIWTILCVNIKMKQLAIILNIDTLINQLKCGNNPDNFDTGLYSYLNRITLLSRDDMEGDGHKGKALNDNS